MAQINIYQVPNKDPLDGTDRVLIWPSSISSVDDLQYVTLTQVSQEVADLLTYTAERLRSLDVAERDALTPSLGEVIFNNEENYVQVWNGTRWTNVGETFFQPLSTAQRDALVAPFQGQVIFNTDTAGIDVYDGSDWFTYNPVVLDGGAP